MATQLPLDPSGSTDGSNVRTKVISLDPNRISFILDGVDLALANSLRRTMTADIETLAIHSVEVESNTSVLPDEMLAHRLGMIPLNSSQVLKEVPNRQRVRISPPPSLFFADDGTHTGLQLHDVLRRLLDRAHVEEKLHRRGADVRRHEQGPRRDRP